MSNDKFEDLYQRNHTPWELHRPDRNLIDMVQNVPVPAGHSLDIGCGTGDNAIWLAEQGFTSTGCDVTSLAIHQAMDKAEKAKQKCTFMVLDFLEDEVKGAPFSFLFDRGCFHSFASSEERKRFSRKAASILQTDGLWLSLTGNADELRDSPGPPQLSALQIVSAVEPWFEIVSLAAGYFDYNRLPTPKNWICLMKKRGR